MGRHARNLELAKEQLKNLEKIDQTVEKGWAIQPLPWNQFRTRKARPVVFFIENLIERNRSNLIFGDSGTGKSRIGWEACNSIAFGHPMWGRQTIKGRVLIIDGEMSDGEIQDRQDNWTKRCVANGINLAEEDFENISFFTGEMAEEMGLSPIDLFIPACRKAIEPILLKYDLIMFDNLMGLSCLNSLSKDYTDAHAWEDIRKWVEPLERKGLTFIWIHHTNKEGFVRGTNTIKQHMTVVLKTVAPKILAPDNTAFHCGLTFNTKGRSIKEMHKTPLYLRMLDDHSKDPRREEHRPKFNGWFIDPINREKPQFEMH